MIPRRLNATLVIRIAWLLILGAWLLVLGILAWSKIAWGQGFNPLPWPHHIEWTQYKVGEYGYVMCKRSTPADSTKSEVICIALPPGTEVYVPRIVPGWSKDEAQRREWRKTAK